MDNSIRPSDSVMCDYINEKFDATIEGIIECEDFSADSAIPTLKYLEHMRNVMHEGVFKNVYSNIGILKANVSNNIRFALKDLASQQKYYDELCQDRDKISTLLSVM